jgi:hypothetical protein
MRTTLLFVAVLLACTPVHAQATAPPQVPTLNAWLIALLPTPATEATRQTVARRRRVSPKPAFPPQATAGHSPLAEYRLAEKSATLLAHDSNAP